MREVIINIGKDFTRFPLGRKAEHGSGSGEEFRLRFLEPALNSADVKVIILLDDALGYGSSFLEEAFGGLVRCGHQADELLSRIDLRTDDPSLIEEVTSYIREARKS